MRSGNSQLEFAPPRRFSARSEVDGLRRFSTRIPDGLKRRVQIAAARRGITVGQFFAEAMQEKIELLARGTPMTTLVRQAYPGWEIVSHQADPDGLIVIRERSSGKTLTLYVVDGKIKGAQG